MDEVAELQRKLDDVSLNVTIIDKFLLIFTIFVCLDFIFSIFAIFQFKVKNLLNHV